MAGCLHGSIFRDRGIARMAAGECRDVAGRDWREAFIEAYRYNWDPWRAAGRHVMAEADSALLDT
jgi:hypothetical protein